ncbi:MAG: GNAT family N-acetyltransferase [Caulobacteraceae bacterium]
MSRVNPLQPPRLLAAPDDAGAFRSGQETLDLWLRRRALTNQASGASRTYVLVHDARVIAYYALAAAAVAPNEAPGRIRRNMPDPIPVILIGRLAVDLEWQGRGLGAALLRDAVERSAEAARIVGVRGVLVRAISDEAARFYRRNGFVESPLDSLTLLFGLPRP